jgi:hypothetical protein
LNPNSGCRFDLALRGRNTVSARSSSIFIDLPHPRVGASRVAAPRSARPSARPALGEQAAQVRVRFELVGGPASPAHCALFGASRLTPRCRSGPPLRAFADAARRGPVSFAELPTLHVSALATVLLAHVQSFGRSDATLSRLGNSPGLTPHGPFFVRLFPT